MKRNTLFWMHNSPVEQLPNTYRPFFGKFSALTGAQKTLIQPILEGRDIVLHASTGSGKTEAVLAPVTEMLLANPDHFTIIYIVPTRALALDMNRRIKPLYRQLGLKCGIRTGDGKTVQNAVPHLLILTPESLDVLLGSQNCDNKIFLKNLRVMIIDEVHMFLHNGRGHQLFYLRCRLKMQTIGAIQTVALSATISHYEEIVSFFKLNNVFYYRESATRRLEPSWIYLKDEEEELVPFFDDLSLRWGCQKLLVFANSRKKCEQLCSLLKYKGVFSQNVLLHYSNLSTKERRAIESSFRNNKKSLCIATSTLEMGIDIGDVDGVVLIEPPPSTMAMLQRIGRGNRRQQYVKFWGVCQGANAGQQLVRFLALFELAKVNQVEKVLLEDQYSVLLQQIVSCLYAKKITSKNSLTILFQDQKEELHAIFHKMIDDNWLKATSKPGLFYGGWRYLKALRKQQIWSNFPPTDEEYDVILKNETIAVLPLSAIRQLQIGDLIQLAGKVLKVLCIEEKRTSREVWVEQSDASADKEFFWVGSGIPVSFEVAQKMQEILSGKEEFQGLLNRTRFLLAQERESMNQSVLSPNGILVHRLENGIYRYETFLGSMGNWILYHLIKKHYSKVEDLYLQFDACGIECNKKIFFENVTFPYSFSLFQEWVMSNLALVKESFLWNNWFYWLPEHLQIQAITTYLFDVRVFKRFEQYQKEATLFSDYQNRQEVIVPNIPLKGKPYTFENEKESWEKLNFSAVPSEINLEQRLTATQIQNYVIQKLCPRLAHFQRLNFSVALHPRFRNKEQEVDVRKKQGRDFKKQVIKELKNTKNVRWATTEFTWKEAIQEVIMHQKPLFLVKAKLESNFLKGSPDLIYIKYEGSHVCLEVWDIKNGYAFTYAQKWKIAFHAYLLELLVQKESFSLTIKLSYLGGLVYRHRNQKRLFERTAFLLAHYTSWMPRLIAQWEKNSTNPAAHSMDSHCTSCSYFSYCYQETLLSMPASCKDQTIVPLHTKSNDFPKNSKLWFFIYYDQKSIRWQCWNQKAISDTCIASSDYPNWNSFQEAVIQSLEKQWSQAVKQEKNPHFLVYESSDWFFFQEDFKNTSLQSLWATHVSWTSIQSVLQKHFIWPIEGRLTASQVALCLGIVSDLPPQLSLYHRESPWEISFDLYRDIWNWCLFQVKSNRTVVFAKPVSLIHSYLLVHHSESEYKRHEILEFQKHPLSYRVENFRAIGPLSFLDRSWNGKKKCYHFSCDKGSLPSKFRIGDFLKLSLVGSSQNQEGFSVQLESYLPEKGIVSVTPLSKKIYIDKDQLYALDENVIDWNGSKIEKVLNLLKDGKFRPELIQMLLGKDKNISSNTSWVQQWYDSHAQQAGLNSLQKEALMLPFRKNIGLIEGPPGTGKTHLLVWTLIAIAAHAKSKNQQIKILVSALTHQAIDQILIKVAKTLSTLSIPISLLKCGRFDHVRFQKLGIQLLSDHQQIDQNCIVGATGFGLYQLLENKNFPQIFDWVLFDEASQILPSHALLSLIFGKGKALFYGDTQQLPPVLMGHYDDRSYRPCSILKELISQYSQNRLRLNETYRLNEDICNYVSHHWYENELRSVVAKQDHYLKLASYPIFHDLLDELLDPSQSMVAVELSHEGCRQSSLEEALWIAKAVQRLIEDYQVSVEEIGIISPHRLQNHTIDLALKEVLPFKRPKIDTVERMQGLEFDVVIFSATVSDKEVIHSSFLKDYRRFNVAITRARKKFLFVASSLFFQSFPSTEKELIAHFPFEDFILRCKTQSV